jgi:hypothetical protein
MLLQLQRAIKLVHMLWFSVSASSSHRPVPFIDQLEDLKDRSNPGTGYGHAQPARSNNTK